MNRVIQYVLHMNTRVAGEKRETTARKRFVMEGAVLVEIGEVNTDLEEIFFVFFVFEIFFFFGTTSTCKSEASEC